MFFFFFKQKTAYEMRISDWSSDVCSSDLATIIGFIALAGVAAEFGVVMLLYLHHAWEHQLALDPHADQEALDAAIREGAVQRVRPKAMTVAVIPARLFPILLGHGAVSEGMPRIADRKSVVEGKRGS